LRARTHTHTHTHTHMLYRSCHCWKHRRKASFAVFQSSAVAFDLMPSTVAKRGPLRPIFRAGNSQKSLGARPREYGCWLMTTSDVWLGALSSSRSHYPCHLSHRFLCRTCKVTLCPGGTNSWCTEQSISKNSGNFLTAPRKLLYGTQQDSGRLRILSLEDELIADFHLFPWRHARHRLFSVAVDSLAEYSF
jgi:hypothetical protein